MSQKITLPFKTPTAVVCLKKPQESDDYFKGCSVVLFSVNAALSQLSDHVLSLLAEGFKIVRDEIHECN
uniref:Uncharacterized protein n=1 Tax=Daucus carota subsp. sativus TaxID=79200 RepID=A0A166CYP1_DAUCS